METGGRNRAPLPNQEKGAAFFAKLGTSKKVHITPVLASIQDPCRSQHIAGANVKLRQGSMLVLA